MIDGLVDGSMGMMSVNFWTDVAIYLLLPNFCLSPSSLLLRRRILNQFCISCHPACLVEEFVK